MTETVNAIVHVPTTTAERAGIAPARRASTTASHPDNDDAAIAGANAVRNPDSAKYTSHAALLTLVSAAHDHDTPATPAASTDRRAFAS